MTFVTFPVMGGRAVFNIQFELINGLKLGIEHISGEDMGEDEEGPQWLIAIDLLIFRIGLLKF